jgi:deoxyadenosine/deoxycytidine kinase
MPLPSLIAIAGIIGVGKTTLAQKLAKIMSASCIFEEYDKNPFLPRQVAGDPHAALPSELFFLLSRARQLAPENLNSDQTYIADYIFEKNRIFARAFLDKHQFAIYDEVERAVVPHIVNPHSVIYLTDRIETCHERIIRRGRDFEKPITLEWLDKLNRAYNNLFESWQKCPLIRLDGRRLDLRSNQTITSIARQLPQIPAASPNTATLTETG